MIALEVGEAGNKPAHREGRQCRYVKQPTGSRAVLHPQRDSRQTIKCRAGFGEQVRPSPGRHGVTAGAQEKRNREALRQMGVPNVVADRLLQNHLLSPRHETVIVEAMKTLRGIPGRTAFIQYAARADNEDAALLFQEMAELLAGYHRIVAPIRRLDIYLNIPVAYTSQGLAVILLPIDRLLWTERSSGIAVSLAQSLPKPLPAQHLEVCLTGDASARAQEGLKQLGITLVEHVGERLPLLD